MVSIADLILIVTITAALGQNHKVAVKDQIFDLDMALNSVDDQYEGCLENMRHLVNTYYLDEELSNNSKFSAAWAVGLNKSRPAGDGLTRNHSVAIWVYTDTSIYADFNNAVRNGKQNYIDKTYQWYSLHFLLTEAIQILQKTQQDCKLTYRGTNVAFNVTEKEVRFGSFASSSLNRSVAEGFGNESCFEIHTCEGAELTKYSVFPEQKEVLIPPYEKFKVTAVVNGSWCKTVYKLQSSGKQSYLNCAVASINYLKRKVMPVSAIG